jgi:hypothetical protein
MATMYTVYASKAADRFEHNYTLTTESFRYDDDTTYEGQEVEAYAVAVRDGKAEEFEHLIASDGAVVTFGRDPEQHA